MENSTLLHRQVHPSFIQKEQVSSQVFETEKAQFILEVSSVAFTPTPKDEKKLSVYNGEKYSPKEAFEHFTKFYNSGGVLSVKIEECRLISLSAIEDNNPFDGHSFIDFSSCTTNGEIKRNAKKLKKYALDRGWGYFQE
ncbi:MAG: hypothetical protein RL679_837 [Bacteroidota bacterium]|jgi:hypothetical protein